MKWLLGKTGYSFLDVWTLPHLGFWVFVGSTLWAFKANMWWSLLGCVVVAYGWELFEHFISYKRWPHRWKCPESWWNSLISDPLTCLIGVLGMYILLNIYGG
jgi:hypothetical protein